MAPARRRRRSILALSIAALGVLAMLLVAVVFGPTRLVAGDGHYVFAAGRSLAYDGDLDLTNQYWVMGDRWGLGRDPTFDRWRLPPREIGPSLVMVPGLWLHWLAGAGARWEPGFACLGAAASLGLTWLGCVRVIEASSRHRRGAELEPLTVELLGAAAVFGFVVPYYAAGASAYPHALDAAIGAWLAWALLARRHPGLIGALLACAVLIRMQNLLWLLWPAAELALALRATRAGGGSQPGELKLGLTRLGVIAAIGALGFLPQLWLGLAHPGSERGALGWTLGFFDLQDYARDCLRVLLGAHGLVSWTPIAGVALLALALAAEQREAKRERAASLAVLVGLWLLLASVRDVDGGDAFGARRLAGVVGLLALGLGRLPQLASKHKLGPMVLVLVLALLVGVNLVQTGRAIAGDLSLSSATLVRGHR